MVKAIPFLLEDELSSLGGKYEKAAQPWGVSCLYTRRSMMTELVHFAGARRRGRPTHHWTKPRVCKRGRGGNSARLKGLRQDFADEEGKGKGRHNCIIKI